MAHQYMPKVFHDPHKNPPVPPPTYLMYGPLVKLRRVQQNQCFPFNSFLHAVDLP